MTSSPDISVFKQKLAERKAAQEAASVKKKASHETDLVPDEQYDISDIDKEMDEIVSKIDILDAYTRWCGKMTPKLRSNQRESIMISCPIPTHPDKVPSAWINLDKQTWYCGGCSEGGDAHDIAAYHFGFSVPAYKTGAQFHELRREMAKDFGYSFTMLPGGAVQVEAPEEEGDSTDTNSSAGTVTSSEPTSNDNTLLAPVVELFEEDDELENILIPALDWRSIVPRQTFLDTYMQTTCIDDLPETFHFWNGLLALGFAMGRDVRLWDDVSVYGNLFICTLGRSGSGKSKARHHLNTLLKAALPHVWTDENSKGVRSISAPASAEVLIHNFQKPVNDPTNPKTTLYNAPVRGLIDFSELSSLTARSNRMGNAIIPTLMQFYDMDSEISTSSMSTGAKTAALPFASALTTSQPKALKELLTKQDASSGFLNRWVFVSGKEKERTAIGGIKVDMTPTFAPLQEILAYSSTFKSDEDVMWSKDAAERFTKFFHVHIQPDKKRDQSELLVRIDLLMKKLILLFTANLKLRTVPVAAVEMAISCYDYIIQSYAIPAEEIGSTLSGEIVNAVLAVATKQLEKDGKGVSMRDIGRSLARRKYPMDLLLKVCDGLVKLGELRMEKTPLGKNGRPTVRYKKC